MSIKLRFEKGTLITQVTLKDSALVALLALISEHQSDDPPALLSSVPTSGLVLASAEASTFVKEWVRKHTASEVLNQIKWTTNPEKILLMGAYHEAKLQR